MTDSDTTSRKQISTREWYDFIGNLADVLPGIHLGGQFVSGTGRQICTAHIGGVATSKGTNRCIAARGSGICYQILVVLLIVTQTAHKQ